MLYEVFSKLLPSCCLLFWNQGVNLVDSPQKHANTQSISGFFGERPDSKIVFAPFEMSFEKTSV